MTHAVAWITWVGGVALVIIVGALSLTPAVDVQPPMLGWDKANHALAYAAITFWWCGLLPSRRLRVMVLAIGYGLLLEALQGLMPPRHPDLLDGLANAVGASLGLVVASVLLRRGWMGASDALRRRLAT